MKYNSLREELKQYYWYEADKKADDFADECFKILDNSDWEKMNPYQMKIFQYKTITDMFEPVIFDNSPFYFETGTMCATCDGAFFGQNQVGKRCAGKFRSYSSRRLDL